MLEFRDNQPGRKKQGKSAFENHLTCSVYCNHYPKEKSKEKSLFINNENKENKENIEKKEISERSTLGKKMVTASGATSLRKDRQPLTSYFKESIKSPKARKTPDHIVGSPSGLHFMIGSPSLTEPSFLSLKEPTAEAEVPTAEAEVPALTSTKGSKTRVGRYYG